MDFDSHVSGVMHATVALVNTLTPGWAGGREWHTEYLPEATERALAHGSWGSRAVTPGEVDQLASYAASLREAFEHVDRGDTDAACERTNALLTDTGAVPMLARHDGEPWHLHFHAADAPYARGWAAAMATSLAIVLGSVHADRIGLCSASSCDRVYVDTSRNGTRRFCSTACQNRAKAAAFRERRASESR
ncbi:putative RNA-binding Zn ribbon-like protein [Saccharopolyspora lacisalsi]|uniref:Putative RNA-binding Zn ribbon-like protein n=1 Tax=Halosaccharopolyspora lacisalsi TaxID=1000566 RepID=A0A839E134_9PSEU|nr:CGNR zinc finger domain-containing protein [Halosaccharopolyspora lacisalsi]MBA8826619.1 putative RNA-binding Zn ribbon-like protein [Halosaccharopolyspora lacisalsi]